MGTRFQFQRSKHNISPHQWSGFSIHPGFPACGIGNRQTENFGLVQCNPAGYQTGCGYFPDLRIVMHVYLLQYILAQRADLLNVAIHGLTQYLDCVHMVCADMGK